MKPSLNFLTVLIFALMPSLAAPVARGDEPAKPDHGHAAGQGSAQGSAHGHGTKPPPADGVTSLDLYPAGDRLHLLTGEKWSTDPAGLRYQQSVDGGATWSPSVPVGVGQPGPEPAKRGADAQVAAAGDKLVAVWTTFGATDRMGRGPMATALSADGGKTWRAGPNPADDGLATGHAFVDVAADESGAFHCVWLDSRHGKDKGLRYARSADGGATWSANQTLVAATCECCWNAVATAAGGRVWVLYRQKAPRDMAVVASADGGKTWSAPAAVGAFDWQLNACPHVGGAIVPVAGAAGAGGNAAGGDAAVPALHAVVWTAKGGESFGCYRLSSADAGRTWGAPARLGDWRSNHPDLASDGQGNMAAAWDALTEQGRIVLASTSADGGRTWSEPAMLSDTGANATHPRVVPAAGTDGGGGGGFRVVWTQTPTGQPATWKSAAVPAGR